MAKFKKLQTLNTIIGTGIVPVYYNGDALVAKNVVKACYAGGIRAFEFTNRGDRAHEIFRELIVSLQDECPELV